MRIFKNTFHRIQGKMLITLLPVLILIMGVFSIIVISETNNNSKMNAKDIMDKYAENAANDLKSEFNSVHSLVLSLKSAMEKFESIPAKDRRTYYTDFMSDTLSEFPSVLDIWTCWEPNALDNMDNAYKNSKESDKTGRFIPTVSRDGDNTVIEPLVGYTNEVEGAYYYQPFSTKKIYVSNPYTYELNGKTYTLMTISYPIIKGNKPIGAVGIDMVCEFFDEINNAIKLYNTGYGKLLSADSTVVAHKDSNLLYKEDVDLTGEYRDEILERISKNELYEATVYTSESGINEYKAFAPVRIGETDVKWIYATVVPEEEILADSNRLSRNILTICIVGVVVIILLCIWVATSISRPINKSIEYLSILSNGDLSKKMNPKLLKRKDEVGDIAKALTALNTSFHNIIETVIERANESSDLISESKSFISELTENVNHSSQLTNEMASEMEKAAVISKEMETATGEIEIATNTIAERAQEGADKALKISNRAAELKSEAIKSRESALAIKDEVNQKLTVAIEEAKSIDEITNLSQDILSITSQTNLLALNASIEAARAGESGRGFVVVAEEIRNLAESSKETVEKIQKITDVVVKSVHNLSDNSKNVIRFIDEKVIEDYNSLVRTGEQYNEDALYMNDSMADFSAASEELLASVHNLIESITQVANISNSSSDSISELAAKSHNMKQMAENTDGKMENVEHASEELVKSARVFKI